MQRPIASSRDIDNAIKELADLREARLLNTEQTLFECEYEVRKPVDLSHWTSGYNKPKRIKPAPVDQQALPLTIVPEKFIGTTLDLSDFMEE